MKVVKTDNNTNTMTLAEGVVLPEGLDRIAVTYLDGEYCVEDGQWYRRDDEGGETPSTTYWSAAGRPPRRSVPGSRSSWA